MVMDEKQLRANLDSQIKTLLAEIEQIVPVKFTLWDEDYCACQLHKDANGNQVEAEIFYKAPVSQAKLAHELLHAKTSLTLGDNSIMFNVVNPDKAFIYLMQHENASNIVNACEHVIFFPDYLEMGYKEEDSFEQAKDLQARIDELNELVKNGLKDNGHYSLRVYNYLGLVFTFLFYPIADRFKKEVKQLRKIDIPLFSIVKRLRDSCDDLVVEPSNKAFIQNAYLTFAIDMNAWMARAFKGAVFTC